MTKEPTPFRSTTTTPTTRADAADRIQPEPGSGAREEGATRQRTSSAASVVAQTQKRLDARRGVADLGEARLRQTKLHISEDLHEINVEFPGRGPVSFDVDLSFLAAAAHLARPLAEGFRVYGVGKRQKTIQGRRAELRIGFLAFLRDKGLLQIRLEEIDRPLWSAFKQWLDTRVDGKTGKVIHPKTRATRFGSVVGVLGALKSVPEYAVEARAAFDARPSFTWDYIATRTEPRERLPIEDLRAIDVAAAADIGELRARVEQRELMLRAGREKLVKPGFDLFDLATCVAYVAQKYPEGLPTLGRLKSGDPVLYAAVGQSKRRHYGLREIKNWLYPSARELVPLVLSVAIASAMNPTTLFELNWKDIEHGELLGEPVVRIGGAKWRAGEDPLVPISAPIIQPTLELTQRATQIVRKTVISELADRLFLFCNVNGPVGLGFGWDQRGLKCSGVVWHAALARFCDDHALRHFTLSQIRATIGDEVALREGVVVASQVLGHKSVRTTDGHYVSDGTRWREAERLGKSMLLRGRWFRSDGKIDPRRQRLTPRMDHGAATPGFHCFDPYDSPWPTQRKGRLCTAYGRCPSCPLAAADVGDPSAVALYLALRDAIFAAQGNIIGEAWLARYGQVVTDLDALLRHVRPEVLAAARRFSVQLPPVE